KGSSLASNEAKQIVASLDDAIARATSGHASVSAVIAGGPAIARDAEKMIRRDLYLSSAASTILVAVAFLLTFRRPRALLAIAPPLMAGTLWTAAIAALFPGGIEAIAMGFASVVIGVGLDTGVHVYAAIVRARHELGAAANDGEVAVLALSRVARPTLTAAIAAGCAFATLGLSSLRSLRELGLLCAAGEVLTAIAIVAMTPWIAARLERTPRVATPLGWVDRVAALAASTSGARVVGVALALVFAAVVVVGPPRADSAVVAVKPKGLPSLAAQEDAIRLASTLKQDAPSGAPQVQLIVLQRASFDDEPRLLARGEALLSGLRQPATDTRVVEGVGDWLPSDDALARRLASRDRALADRRPEALAAALESTGFSSAPFEAAIDRLRQPATLETARAAIARLREGPLSPIVARHLARDHAGDGSLWLATYVRGPGLDADALAREVATIDGDAIVTGYPVLELSLRRALSHDLPRLGLVALLLVAIALRTVLRDAREVLVVLAALVGELLLVALGMRAFHVPLHVYDALVLPVLVGITVDESMFLLHAMHESPNAHAADAIAAAVAREGRAVVTTACTTAAGFVALLACAFPGLRDLGAVGALGTLAGLVASLVVVPALARLTA
ncbi:MAG: MMPL family transporter, partial [Polyangiales bacterium]